MKKPKKIDARFPISAALKNEWYCRLERLRCIGWKISEIFKLGIEEAEKTHLGLMRFETEKKK